MSVENAVATWAHSKVRMIKGCEREKQAGYKNKHASRMACRQRDDASGSWRERRVLKASEHPSQKEDGCVISVRHRIPRAPVPMSCYLEVTWCADTPQCKPWAIGSAVPSRL